MGRRRRDVEHQTHVVGTAVRNNSLNKLVLLHNAVADVWSSNRRGSKLFQGLVERRRKNCPDYTSYPCTIPRCPPSTVPFVVSIQLGKTSDTYLTE